MVAMYLNFICRTWYEEEQEIVFNGLHSCSYLQYSGICARLLRQALKPEYRASALKREESLMKVQKWKDGQPGAPGLQDCSNKSPLNYCATVYIKNGGLGTRLHS